MNTDLFLVIGLIVGALSFPALISAFTHGRAPRAPAILVMIATGMIVIAVSGKPGGYTWEDVPRAFVRVVNSIVG